MLAQALRAAVGRGGGGATASVVGAARALASSSSSSSSSFRLTTLPSGVRVATVGGRRASAALSVFLNFGSRNESPALRGCSLAMEKLFFQSSATRSAQDMAAELGRVGANVFSATQRDFVTVGMELLEENATGALELLADTVQSGAYAEDEVEGVRSIMASQLEEVRSTPDVLASELVFEAAYGGNPLGQSALPLKLVGEHSGVAKEVSREAVLQYRAQQLVAGNVVVAGVGVDHDWLADRTRELFRHLPEGGGARLASQAASPPPYIRSAGASLTQFYTPKPDVPPSRHFAHVALAFDAPAWRDDAAVPAFVTAMLLGGGTSFSSGGPGKGMFSRFYQHVMMRNTWLDSAMAMCTPFVDAGVLTMHASCLPRNTVRALELVLQEVRWLRDAPFEEGELERAKNRLKSIMMMNLEMRGARMEDAARQLLVYGEWNHPADMVAKIDGVTEADVRKCADAMVHCTPSLAFVLPTGSPAAMPTPQQVQDALAFGID